MKGKPRGRNGGRKPGSFQDGQRRQTTSFTTTPDRLEWLDEELARRGLGSRSQLLCRLIDEAMRRGKGDMA